MDLRPYICKQCGGQIDPATMRCRHCDTEYYDPHLRRVTISAVQPGEARLRAEVRIDYENMMRYPESARDYALRELRNQIADGLLAYMKITTCEDFGIDFNSRKEIIRGEVRVIDPMFEDRW